MASFTLMKHTTAGACRGQVAHIYRTNENYSNGDIRKELEGENLYLRTAEESRAAIKATIRELDEKTPPKRVKADRKTVAELCFPAPREGMDWEDSMKFFNAVLEYCNARFTVVGGGIHFDEIHDYIDPGDKQLHTSREHLHLLIVPDVPGKGCNMKSFATKALYNELNQALNELCRQELGYDYNDGTRQRSRGKVEDMKCKSALEAVRQLPELQREVEAQKASVQQAEQEAAAAIEQARNRVKQARNTMKKLSGKSTDDIIEERTYKTGLFHEETVVVAKEPEAIKAAVADAVVVQNHNELLERQMEQLKQKNKQLERELEEQKSDSAWLEQELREAQKANLSRELYEAGFSEAPILERSIGFSTNTGDSRIDQLSIQDAGKVLEEYRRYAAEQEKLQRYDQILATAMRTPSWRDALRDYMPEIKEQEQKQHRPKHRDHGWER